ncbi:probable protein phosphatase 2C 47 [Elaeis guineensis]|uniref:protein-serine/threonine phosphatase n=1 Tax=Elaeis guineensis var. tenera TaxID=51953 RepID=A0A6I9SDY3_ELAGV|nr:probable protein phosphatase 2C 47 [Elaeis guineensis]
MVAGTEVLHQSIPVLEAQYRCVAKEIVDVSAAAAATAAAVAAASSSSASELESRDSDAIPDILLEPELLEFVPTLRSGSYTDIGTRKDMEDEHICINDLPAHLGYLFRCPTPSAFYGVFDGHGGPDAAAYIRRHAIRFLFEEASFPQASQVDNAFLDEVESSIRKSFLNADLALANDCTISSSSGTTALTALVLGRLLLVANIGDCRAVLCRKGEAVEMSQDHRPIHEAELQRIKASGGFVDDGYLNGVLSVTRALGDWDMKFPCGSCSPLISEPEFRQTILSEEDEFLIMGCDGIWDVMSSQHAVSIVRRGLRRHDNPEQCARDLVMEALQLKAIDNLTVIVVCFSSEHRETASPSHCQDKQQPPRLRYCSLSTEALCNLRSWLDNDGGT